MASRIGASPCRRMPAAWNGNRCCPTEWSPGGAILGRLLVVAIRDESPGPGRSAFAWGLGLQQLNRVMGLNVILGVFAYRGLLTFKPVLHSASQTTLTRDVEDFFFTPSETAPLVVVLLSLWILYHRRVALFALPRRR